MINLKKESESLEPEVIGPQPGAGASSRMIIETMTRIPQTDECPEEGNYRLCNRVHGAGFAPNTMNRFVLSNSHEVLFVN